jgi:hypothetical protein
MFRDDWGEGARMTRRAAILLLSFCCALAGSARAEAEGELAKRGLKATPPPAVEHDSACREEIRASLATIADLESDEELPRRARELVQQTTRRGCRHMDSQCFGWNIYDQSGNITVYARNRPDREAACKAIPRLMECLSSEEDEVHRAALALLAAIAGELPGTSRDDWEGWVEQHQARLAEVILPDTGFHLPSVFVCGVCEARRAICIPGFGAYPDTEGDPECKHEWMKGRAACAPIHDGQIILVRMPDQYAAIRIEEQDLDNETHSTTIRYTRYRLPPGETVFDPALCAVSSVEDAGAWGLRAFEDSNFPTWSIAETGRGCVDYLFARPQQDSAITYPKMAILAAQEVWGLDAAAPSYVYKASPFDGVYPPEAGDGKADNGGP